MKSKTCVAIKYLATILESEHSKINASDPREIFNNLEINKIPFDISDSIHNVCFI